MAAQDDMPVVIDPIFPEESDPSEGGVEDDMLAVDQEPHSPQLDIEQEEMDYDEALLAAGEEEDPEAGQMMSIHEHNDIVDAISDDATAQIQAANVRVAAAEASVGTEEATTRRIRALLQNAQMDRSALQARNAHLEDLRIIALQDLEKRIVDYPVENGRADYFMDRSVVRHMIWEAIEDAHRGR